VATADTVCAGVDWYQRPRRPKEASLDPGVGNTTATIDFEKSVAGRSHLDWVTGLANTHAKFVQDLTGFYIKAARGALK
jgi:hypothetical protein